MGCGASSLGPEDADLNRQSNPLRRHRAVRPITDEPVRHIPPLTKDDDVIPSPLNTSHRDDALKGPGSPSFREYCTDFNPRCPSKEEYTNDDSDSGESTDNTGNDTGNDDSIISKSKPRRKEITNPNKENEKKERKGRRLRDVINKGRTGGKKMSFTRHRSANKYDDNRAGRVA